MPRSIPPNPNYEGGVLNLMAQFSFRTFQICLCPLRPPPPTSAPNARDTGWISDRNIWKSGNRGNLGGALLRFSLRDVASPSRGENHMRRAFTSRSIYTALVVSYLICFLTFVFVIAL